MVDLLDIENLVVTRIQNEFSEDLLEKYPNIDFTSTEVSNDEPSFPTVYIHMLPSPEIGQTVEGTDLSGIFANFQIDVSDNQSKQRTKEVSAEVVRILKTMRFSINQMPYPERKDGVFYSILRARRTIGAGDEF